jgi:SAM-dependent methyltransferase
MDSAGRGTGEGVGEGIAVPDDTPPCLVCGATRWLRLPDPGPFCMASDWRLVTEPLGRLECQVCGLAVRVPTPSVGDGLYRFGYRLYAHAPGGHRELARQALYAQWIASAVASAPAQVLDVGCGNGSLLRALADVWPGAALYGCDLSADSVAHGGTLAQLWCGGVAERPRHLAPDLLVSVNVIEHCEAPDRWLAEVGDALDGQGRLVLICPDGSRPGVELLIADHLFSFTPDHLQSLLDRAGFSVVHRSMAPKELGDFQLALARAGAVRRSVAAESPASPHVSTPCGPSARAAYLEQWRELDGALRQRTPARVTCFGAGETAGLLRAYAPGVWASVTACTADETPDTGPADMPFRRLDDLPPDEPLLLAVRPADQPRLEARLRSRFQQVISWYDLVDAG